MPKFGTEDLAFPNRQVKKLLSVANSGGYGLASAVTNSQGLTMLTVPFDYD